MYGDFQSDTGVNLPTPGIDPSYTDPEKQRQRLMGAMLAAHARNMAQDVATPAPDSSTLTSMVTADPNMNGGTASKSATPPQQADVFPDKNAGMGPQVGLTHAVLEDQPATKYVTQAQGNLDTFNKNARGWRSAIGPAMITAASLLGAHSYNGQHLQDTANADMLQLHNQRFAQQQSLVKQLEDARVLQQQEYEADQRNRQQDIIAAGNNQTKTLMAQIAAGSRNYGADRRLEGTQYGADTRLEGTEYGADRRLEGTQATANAHVSAARYAADAALNRFLMGQDRADQRQQRGFAHTDLKPTADEDRRAELARAAQGYATELLDLAQNRPDLWGSLGQGAYFLGGRGTTLRNMLGSSDPDVARMRYLKEQLGITNMGAHSLRSAQAIGPISDSLVNSFNTDPKAAAITIQDAINQLSMFTGPQHRPAIIPGTVGGQGQGVTPQQPQSAGTLTDQVGGAVAPARPGSRPEVVPTGREAPNAAAAQPGDTVRGWIYLGGDKNKQDNWGKVGGQ